MRSCKPYTVFAHYYDAIMEGISYGDWVCYLEKLLQRHQAPGRRILDLACGTGSVSLILAQRGYHVVGLDLSWAMIEEARKKERGDLDLTFRTGDMRHFHLEERVDTIISLYDAVNYMLEEEDLYRVFTSCYGALNPDGLYIFDVNTRHRLRQVDPGTCLYEGDGFFCFWKDIIYPEPLIWQVDLTFFVEQGDGTYCKYQEIHRERAYSRDVLSRILQDVGFTLLSIYGDYTLCPVQEEGPISRYFFVGRKGEEHGNGTGFTEEMVEREAQC